MGNVQNRLIMIGTIGALALAGFLFTSRDAAAQSDKGGGPKVIIEPLPLPVSLTNDSVGERQVFRRAVTLGLGTSTSTQWSGVAPADKLIVVDVVAGTCLVPAGAACSLAVAIIGSQVVTIPGTRNPGNDAFGNHSYAVHSPTRFVIRPGEQYTIVAARNTTTASEVSTADVSMYLMGHYVNCTPASSCPAAIQ